MVTLPQSSTEPSAAQFWQQGVELIAASRPMEAVAALRACVALDPGMAAAWNDLGVLMESLGNYGQARSCYEAALRASPNHREARQNCVALLLEFDLLRALHQAAA
jgi:Flp pilus assembly protein TadD